jgi:phage protein D
MFTPAYKLTIGGKAIDTTDEPQASTVVDLSVSLGIGAPADCFKLVLGNVGGVRPAREDEVKIELGYADNGGTKQVIKGAVAAVEPNLTTTRVIGYGSEMKLLRSFANQTYERMTAGAIVRDLAGKAGVVVAEAKDGITFPAYVVDGRRSIYAHMLDLAEFCGFDLYLTAEDQLVFEKFFNGKTAHLFEYSKHVIALDVLRVPPLAGQVEVWGESPTGSKGNDASAWVTTDFSGSKGAAGSGVTLLLERPALRTTNAARTAANAALTNIQRRTLRGYLLTIGRPEIKLGDAIRLTGMADDALNSNFQVRGVTHRITKSKGFTTRVDFRAIQT